MHFFLKTACQMKGLKDNESSKFTAHYNYSYHLMYIPVIYIYFPHIYAILMLINDL